MSSSRRRRRASTHQTVSMESLENRLLLTVFTIADVGNIWTNGTNLQDAINSAELGDTIVLDANVGYMRAGGFTLPWKPGTGTLTIESADIYYNRGHLPADVRVGPDDAPYMPRLLAAGGNAPVLQTVLKDSSGNAVTTGAHDYALIGLEMSATYPVSNDDNHNDYIQNLVILGDGTSAQSSETAEAHHITLDRVYIHGLEPISQTHWMNIQQGLRIDSSYTTLKNSEISNIRTNFDDGQAIGSVNSTGHITITNNYLQGSTEVVMFGGSTTYIDNNVTSDITFTNNYVGKRPDWNPYDDAFYSSNNNKLSIKNVFELKNAQNVFIDGNVFDNSWLSSNQFGYAVVFTPRNQYGSNPWNMVADVTFTNNVVRNACGGINILTTDYNYPSQTTHDIIIRNNLFERLDNRGMGTPTGINIGGATPMYNLTIEHNTFFSYNMITSMASHSSLYDSAVSSGLVVRDNIFGYGQYGFGGTGVNGNNMDVWNIYASGIHVTNAGSGYTSAPTVVFTGGGGTGARATVTISGGVISQIKLTNQGSGYTSVPAISFTGGGGSGAAAAFDPNAINGGKLGAYVLTNNVVHGAGPQTNQLPAGVGNKYATSLDETFFRDPMGELYDLLPDSAGYDNAHSGSAYPHSGVDPSQFGPDFIPLDANLAGYWKFDEGSGTSVSDSSGHGQNGTLSSSGLWTSSGESYQAVALTGGTSGAMSIPGFTTAGTFSFAAWIKPGSISADSYIASSGNSAFSLYVNSAGKLVATTSNGATATDSTGLSSGTWYLVGCTYDDVTRTLRLFRNGVQVAASTGSGSIASGSTTLYIGGNGGSSSSFKGTIDEVRYYDSDMSAPSPKSPVAHTGMGRLFENYGPLIPFMTPNYGVQSGLTTSFSLGQPVTHYSYNGMAGDSTFTWSQVNGPAGVSWGPTNGTGNSTCVATWPGVGFYNIKVTVRDGRGGESSEISGYAGYGGNLFAFVVPQIPTSMSVSQSSVTLAPGQTQQYTYETSGLDQFGDPLTGAWTWSVASGGAGGYIDVNGLYTAPASGGTDRVLLTYTSNGVATTTTAANDGDVTISGASVPTVSVATSGNLNEYGTSTNFTFTRSGSTTDPLTVKFLISGSATNGADYSTLPTSVTIPAGSASTTLTISTIQDSLIEPTEVATITLTGNSGYAVGSASSASISIYQDDWPTITVARTNDASETGPSAGLFTLTRSGNYQNTPGMLAVYLYVGGTASNGLDYTTLLNSAEFLPGQMTTTVRIDPVLDALTEGTETVALTIMPRSNSYNVGTQSSATVNIADFDSSVPVVSIAATDASAAEHGQDPGLFTITRTTSAGALTVYYAVSGTAANGADYSTIASSVVIPDGSTSATVTVTPIDDTTAEGDETVILTLSPDPNYAVSPSSTATVTIADDDDVNVSIVATDSSAAEPSNTGLFTVTRTSNTVGALTVNYTVTGSAANGTDYNTLSGTVVIPAGAASTTITVTPIDDTSIEGSESVTLTIAGGSGYSVGSPDTATVIIADNDLPLVTIAATTPNAAEPATDGLFTVTRGGSGPAVLDGDLTVNLTVSGTAANGTDYVTIPTTVVIPNGQASVTIPVDVIDDLLVEGDETVVLTIAGGTGYTVSSPSTATVTIADDDVSLVTVAATDPDASESGPDTGVFTLTRTGITSSAITVNYTMGGTATSGSDYGTLSGSVSFAAGQTSATITLTPVDDTLIEGSETAILTLTGGSGYTVGTPSAATVTIADNDVASTIAYDGFDYSADAGAPGPLNGADGGHGFTGPWSVTGSGTNSSIDAASLIYACGGTTLRYQAGSAALWSLSGGAVASRTISDSGWGVSGSSRWFSFEMSQHNLGVNNLRSYVLLDGQLEIGIALGANQYGARATINGHEYYAPATGAAITADTTVYMVVRIDFGDMVSKPDKVYMWANNQGQSNQSLTPGTVPSDATAKVMTISLPDSLARGSTVALSLRAGQGGVKATFDEVRFGNAYGAVAPRTIPGDANGDGNVDIADYTAWFNHYGLKGATLADGDLDGNGEIDIADYTIWFNHYGQNDPVGSMPVFETTGSLGSQPPPAVQESAKSMKAMAAPAAAQAISRHNALRLTKSLFTTSASDQAWDVLDILSLSPQIRLAR